MIIDHIGLTVGDYDESKQFFCRALAPLAIELIVEVEGSAGLGKGGSQCGSSLSPARILARQRDGVHRLDSRHRAGQTKGALDAAYRRRVVSPPRTMRL
jgi:catechol 2,3-dioxygenase-like lactoylglutathione lyase family enzyme